MTVSSPLAKAVHITHGEAGSYAFPFKVFKEAHLAVGLVDASFRVAYLALGADYTVAGLGRDQGGTVTLTPAGREKAGTGLALVLLRRMEFTQEIDYRPHDVFPAETHERALDILTMSCQELREMMSRALVAPPNFSRPIEYGDLAELLEAAREAAGQAGEAAGQATAILREIKAAPEARAATNDGLGLVKGNAGEPGKVSVDENGEMKVNGWEEAGGGPDEPAWQVLWEALQAKQADVGLTGLGGPPSALVFGGPGDQGSSTAAARADHTHACPEAPGGAEAGGGPPGSVWVRSHGAALPSPADPLVLPAGGTWSGLYSIRVGSDSTSYGYSTVYAFTEAGGSTLAHSVGRLLVALAIRVA